MDARLGLKQPPTFLHMRPYPEQGPEKSPSWLYYWNCKIGLHSNPANLPGSNLYLTMCSCLSGHAYISMPDNKSHVYKSCQAYQLGSKPHRCCQVHVGHSTLHNLQNCAAAFSFLDCHVCLVIDFRRVKLLLKLSRNRILYKGHNEQLMQTTKGADTVAYPLLLCHCNGVMEACNLRNRFEHSCLLHGKPCTSSESWARYCADT